MGSYGAWSHLIKDFVPSVLMRRVSAEVSHTCENWILSTSVSEKIKKFLLLYIIVGGGVEWLDAETATKGIIVL